LQKSKQRQRPPQKSAAEEVSMAARNEASAKSEEEEAKLRAVLEAKAEVAEDEAKIAAEERAKAAEEAQVIGKVGINEAVVEPKAEQEASLVSAPTPAVDGNRK